MATPVYLSDLNDEEWTLLGPLIPTSKPHGRPRSSDMRRINDGCLRAAYLPGSIRVYLVREELERYLHEPGKERDLARFVSWNSRSPLS